MSDGPLAQVADALVLTALILFHLILLILPGVAASLVAFRRGVRQGISLLIIAVLALTTAGYISFWIYFGSRMLGLIFSGVIYLVSAAIVVLSARAWRLSIISFPDLRFPAALMASTALLYASLGFLYGGMEKPLEMAAHRYSHPLPGDNRIPLQFAEMIFDQHLIRPLHADWLSSDRPPLQAAMVLLQRPFIELYDWELQYQFIGILLQLLWIPGLWIFLRRAQVSPTAIALTVFATVFSGFSILHGFYIWPKLFAAAFILMLAGMLVAVRRPELRYSDSLAVGTGLVSAFALLGHGGSAFGLAGILLALVAVRRIPPLRFVAIAALVGFSTFVPWLLYQKLYDPPGNRLIKMHIAGVADAGDNRPIWKALADGYQNLDVETIIEKRVGSLCLMLGRLPNSLWQLRQGMFYHFFHAFGLLNLGFIALALNTFRRKNRETEARAAGLSWVVAGITLAVWVLLMFGGPGETVIHQGSFFPVVLGLAGLVLALWTLSPRLAVVAVGLQTLLNVILFVIFSPPEMAAAPAGLFSGGFNYALAVIGTSAAVCLLLLLRKFG
ncbi:MAG: hypothetical protein ACRD1R_06370 [Acidobacteriota bacterium]